MQACSTAGMLGTLLDVLLGIMMQLVAVLGWVLQGLLDVYHDTVQHGVVVPLRCHQPCWLSMAERRS